MRTPWRVRRFVALDLYGAWGTPTRRRVVMAELEGVDVGAEIRRYTVAQLLLLVPGVVVVAALVQAPHRPPRPEGPGAGGIEGPRLSHHGPMDFPQVWPHLAGSSRSWLMEHNGEPLPDDLLAEILSITGGERNPRWWAGPSQEGETQLTDEAVDWIETVANDDES